MLNRMRENTQRLHTHTHTHTHVCFLFVEGGKLFKLNSYYEPSGRRFNLGGELDG